jgi:hypothetical protein
MKIKIIFRRYPNNWYSNTKEYFRVIDIGFFSILFHFKDKNDKKRLYYSRF